jgi:hypothetical protein
MWRLLEATERDVWKRVLTAIATSNGTVNDARDKVANMVDLHDDHDKRAAANRARIRAKGLTSGLREVRIVLLRYQRLILI